MNNRSPISPETWTGLLILLCYGAVACRLSETGWYILLAGVGLGILAIGVSIAAYRK